MNYPILKKVNRKCLDPTAALVLMAAFVAVWWPLHCKADQFGDFTYIDEGDVIQITGYPAAAVGAVVVPAQIGGKPVTKISSEAFSTCVSITSVALPASVTSIAGFDDSTIFDGPFDGCFSLAGIVVDPGSTSFVTHEGVLFSKDMTVLLKYPPKKEGQSYVIPDGVTRLGEDSFGRANLDLTMPSSVNSIGNAALQDGHFSKLTIMSRPWTGYYAMQSASIGNLSILAGYSFSSGIPGTFSAETLTIVGAVGNSIATNPADFLRYGTKHLVLSEGVTGIAGGAFSLFESLASVSLPSTLTSIGRGSFRHASRLLEVSIPSSVTFLGDDAFSDCYGLTNVSIDGDIEIVGDRVFKDCYQLTEVKFREGVTKIWDSAFEDSWNLSVVTLPTTLNSIESKAFHGCRSLFQINLEDATLLTTIADRSFYECWHLTIDRLPDSVTTIGSEAFHGCSSLVISELPASLVGIGTGAFSSCMMLKDVAFPSGLIEIDGGAFSNCWNLRSATFFGDAPDEFDPSVFEEVNGAQGGEITIYYKNDVIGFTTPEWKGFPAFPIDAPAFASGPPPAGEVGIAYQHDFNAGAGPTMRFWVSAGALPPGLHLSEDEDTGVWRISGTPSVAGIFSGTITASNGVLPEATQEFTIDTNSYRQVVASGTHGSVSGGGVYLLGATATLSAIPDPGYLFSGWTGAASGSANPMNLLVSTNKNVSAIFVPDSNDNDGDGVSNFVELTQNGTNPDLADTDGDGEWDGSDVFPNNPEETQDTNGDGIGDNADTDDDADGLSDQDELTIHHTDPLNADSDGDLLEDGAEITVHQTDPNVPDSDNDGLNDGDEFLTYHTNPLSSDSDGDGFLDGYEVLTGKLPLDPNSEPALVAEANPAVQFSFSSDLDKTYRIEASTNLVNWTVVETGIPGNGEIIDRFYPTKGMPKRFFRTEEE